MCFMKFLSWYLYFNRFSGFRDGLFMVFGIYFGIYGIWFILFSMSGSDSIESIRKGYRN